MLNTLLTLMNERLFDNGAGRAPAPLLCLVGASNELPESDELAALWDRFLLRVPVGPLSEAGVDALLQLDDAPAAAQPPPGDGDTSAQDEPPLRLGGDDVAALRAAAARVALPV